MALDIVEGDVLVVGSSEYPIKRAEDWSLEGADSKSFEAIASVSASTKRASVSVDGGIKKRSAPTTNLTGLSCTPLDPLDSEMAERMGLGAIHTLKQTFVSDGDGFMFLVVERIL